MVLAEKLRELTAISLDDDEEWKRPTSGWTSRNNELSRSYGSIASTAVSGNQSLKSYLSQIKKGIDSRDFQSESPIEEEISINLAGICNNKSNDKYERVKKLESSLCGIQTNVETKRSNILEEIYQKLNNLETKIAEGETLERKNYMEANKKMEIIERNISTVKAKHDLELKDTIGKMEEVYQRFNEAMKKEKEQWKKTEREVIDDVNMQINTIRDDLEDMKKAKTHIASYLRKYIDVELPQLKSRIAAASEDIHKMEKNIVTSTNEDLVMLATFIKHETSQLKEIKRSVLNEVLKNADLTKTQLAKECEERKQMQQRMVALMEETLKRLGSPL
ncbi:hypothetical protein BgAZ_110590 [Babesia gibsoni]|uniref:Uncharacterized protein n=1 Tax=Babesia gibsoni TaxID=33632 RepID=A0AAD8UWJ7_BABGI|nr:hypothetical protein BgAZ_110590 [Babesia gibsoni]